MKTRAITVALMLAGFTAAISQSEYDDVYFSKKDRMKTERVSAQATNTLKALDQTTSVYPSSTYTKVNSTDSYTGRTINPDYQPGGISTVSVSYFTPNYQPMGVNSQLNQNPLYSANNLSPYNSYGNNFNGFNSFNRFGGGYSPFNSGWGYPSYGNNGFNSGFGCNSNYYGMNSYSGWGNSYYGNSFGYGMGYYGGGFGGGFNNWLGFGNNYGYGGSNVVIVNTPDSHINKVYGKRHSRSSDYANTMTNNHTGRGQGVGAGPSTVGGRGGRVATAGASTANTYYQRGWRQNPSINPTTSNTGSRSSSFSGGRSSGSGWMHNSGNSTFNNGWGGDSGSRSSSFGSGGSFGGGGGGRSSGGSTGGGGGSHHSGGGRGRN